MTALIWDLLARDGASPAFLKVAGAADKAAASTAKASLGMQASIARMGATGAALTKKVTLPVLALGAVAVSQASKFQKSMTLIQTAGGETAAKAEAISKGIKKVAVDTGTSLDALGAGIYTVSKAGAQKWSAVDQLIVLKAAAQGAKAENVDLGVATDALTTIMFDYGAKAKDAVKYEDMLIRGSGLAKTSMQEYAASLSNVVPIGAAVGLSFKEIAGAIATMTQHGVTAQRATENLNNLVVNLSGQNNVASQAMQQLGINTVDLSRNLGRRGLSGTLAIVEKALKDHTRNGVVVTNVHKAAALATHSLNEMLGTMGGKLKTNSEGLLKGKVGILDYSKYAKSLGGVAGAGALQFLALYKNALGFSNQLKSGKGTISTTTQQLNKMLGGMTGSNVAMQIGGKYAKENAANVKAVGKAYLESGADVLGWNKTQDTLAVKMDKAKASLQVMAVEIGTALIPAVSKLADVGTKAVHWFDGLSGTQKKVLLWSAGILAAIGPLMSIGGRLALVGRGLNAFALTTASAFTRITTGSSEMSSAVRLSVSRMTSALAGAGIGIAVGSLTRNSSTAVKAVGVLGSALAGAAIGSAGGPWGAAIGAAAGGVGALAVNFLSAGDNAKKGSQEAVAALAAQKQSADELFNSLQAVNGAYGAQFKQAVVKQLSDRGALGIANKAGVKLPSVVNEAIGSNTGAQSAALTMQLEKAASQGKITEKQLLQVERAIGEVGNSAAGNEVKLRLWDAASGKNLLTSRQLGISMRRLRKDFKDTGNTLSDQSAAGQRNTEILKENVGAINAHVAAGLRQGKSVKSVATAYETQIGSLQQNLHALGFNDDAVARLIARYGKIPKSVATELRKRGVLPADIQAIIDKYDQIPANKSTSVTLNDAASARLQYISNLLAGLHDRTVTVTTTNRGISVGGKASGGGLPEGVSSVGENGAELAIKHGSNVEILSNSHSRRFLAATGMRAPGFAGGTKSKADPSRVSSAIGDVGSAAGSKFYVNDVGISRIAGQLRHAMDVLNEEIRKGLSGHAAAAFRNQISGYINEANRQLGKLRLKVSGSDLSALRAGLKGTVDDTKTAFAQLVADMRNAGASSRSLAVLGRAGSQLLGAQSRLGAARGYRSSITDTLRGSFDPTKYGSVTDLLAGLGGATSTNKAYSSELTGLRKKAGGNKTLLGFINTLAASGQTATLESLAGASKSQLAQVAKSVSGYNASVTAGGNAAELVKFGQSVETLAKRQKAITDALVHLAEAFSHRKQELHIGKHAVAVEVVNDPAFERALAKLLDQVNDHHTYNH